MAAKMKGEAARAHVLRELLKHWRDQREEATEEIRALLPEAKKMFGITKVADMLGMSRQGVYNLLNEQNRSTESRSHDL